MDQGLEKMPEVAKHLAQHPNSNIEELVTVWIGATVYDANFLNIGGTANCALTKEFASLLKTHLLRPSSFTIGVCIMIVLVVCWLVSSGLL